MIFFYIKGINIINLIILFCNVFCYCDSIYDPNQALINVWLSGAAYCDKNSYDKMIVAGPASGFLYKNTLYDPNSDLQGFIGIIPNQKKIYIAYRGTSSYYNWMKDLEVRQVPYKTYPECQQCKIHNGFYNSALNVKNQTLDSLIELKKEYPNYEIVLTGHSYGAAVSQIVAMELIKEGIKLEVYNYGQPRLGNKKYADFVNSILIQYWRFTHNKDIVPHLPPIKDFGYFHSCREVFENPDNKLALCSETNCEDPKCADQYGTSQTDVSDHYYYLNHRVQCDESTIVKRKNILSMIFKPRHNLN
jgi:hypothetical protein